MTKGNREEGEEDAIVVVPATPWEAADAAEDPTAAVVGRWYWVAPPPREEEDAENPPPRPWLGCVVAVGSNYAALHGVGRKERVHLDAFAARCAHEPDADGVIREKVAQARRKVRRLLAEVKAVTDRLAVTAGPALPHATDTRALARHEGPAMDGYKAALVRAKETELPALFEAINQANASLGRWLAAPLLPLKAQAEALKPTIRAVEDRIFAVQLYAGLVEEVVRIQDGAPAAVGETIRVHQRRCYMDEECLARYEVGGMEFADLDAFDRWLLRPHGQQHPPALWIQRTR